MHTGKIKGLSGLLFSCLFCSASVTSAGDQDLAKASQNPVADMISLPMKNKFIG